VIGQGAICSRNWPQRRYSVVIEKNVKRAAPHFAEGVVAAESPVQKRMGINVTREELFKVHMNYTHWTLNARLVRALIDKSGDTVAWLEELGLTFSMRSLHRPVVSDNTTPPAIIAPPPVFHIPDNWGSGIIKVLLRKCTGLNIPVLYKTRAEELLVGRNGEINGLKVKSDGIERTLHAKSVVIATGGYSSSKELMQKYCPRVRLD
jgi:fumarate reductase flavoprotein subunit